MTKQIFSKGSSTKITKMKITIKQIIPTKMKGSPRKLIALLIYFKAKQKLLRKKTFQLDFLMFLG